MDRTNAFRLVVSAAVAMIVGMAANAQNAPAGRDTELAEVVVTGSLIQRPNNTAVSPIVSVSDAALKESGQATLVDALNQLPGFTVAGNGATGGQGTGGRASINLHGLGTNRNLVLLDGRRLPMSDVAGNVDVNILPDAIIDGVDAITGGASAIYGSDAMSGVVNFKTVRGFDGVKVDVMNSLSERGDAWRLNASVAFGGKYADGRGNLIAALGYAKQDPVNGSSRSFFDDKTPSSFIGFGAYVPSATNAPNAAVLQGIFTGYGVTSTINPLGNLGFNNDGTLFVQNGAQNYKGPNGTNGYAVLGGNVRMPVGQQIDFFNGLDRKSAFLKTDYDLNDRLTAYAQFMYVKPTVTTHSGGSLTQFASLTTIPVTNPFIPADLATVLASRPNATAPFAWSARYVGVPYKGWDEAYQVGQYLAGIKGLISGSWTFDTYASYDESVHNQTMHNAVLKTQVQRLLNAADGGASLCAGGFDPFGDTNARSLSAACQAFITKDAQSKEDLSQTQFQGQVNGELFETGGGKAQLALLAAYRRNTYSFSPDSDLVSPNGLNVYFPTNPGANIEGVVNTLPVSKKAISVKEFAAQIDVPLVADAAWAKELGVGAAARVSDYSTTGSVKSFEFDGRWRPVQSLLVRGSWQRAVRAPNIAELFSPPQGTQLVIGTPPSSIGDPCDVRSNARTGASGSQVAALCVAQGVPAAAIGSYIFPTTATGQVNSGNPGVTPEKANTYNLGFVWNSSLGGWLSDASASVDYFNIRINDVISTVPGLTVLSKCYNLDGSNSSYSTTNEYCALISRDSAGQLQNVATPYKNLGALRTDGVEVQLHYGLPDLAGLPGKFAVDSALTWLNSYRVQLLPGTAFLDYTGVSVGGAGPGSVPPRATPKWRALTTFSYRMDRASAGLRWRYQSSMADQSAVLTPTNVSVGVPTYQLWDLFGTYKVSKGLEVRAGVNNLLDKGLPFVSSSQNGTDVALYDPIGRSYYLGIKASF